MGRFSLKELAIATAITLTLTSCDATPNRIIPTDSGAIVKPPTLNVITPQKSTTIEIPYGWKTGRASDGVNETYISTLATRPNQDTKNFSEQDISRVSQSIVQLSMKTLITEGETIYSKEQDCTAVAIYKDIGITIFATVKHCMPEDKKDFVVDLFHVNKSLRLKNFVIYTDDSKDLAYLIVTNDTISGIPVIPMDLLDAQDQTTKNKKFLSSSYPSVLIEETPKLWTTEFDLVQNPDSSMLVTDKKRSVFFGGRVSTGSSGGPIIVFDTNIPKVIGLIENVVIFHGDSRYLITNQIFQNDLDMILKILNESKNRENRK